MNVLHAVILGIVQGLTEFLPVSSSGHLVLLQKLFGISEATLAFDIVVHIGTLIPVLIVFWKDIFQLLKNPFQKYTYLLIVATIPAVIVGFVFGDVIENLFKSGQFLALGFIYTGILLLFADRASGAGKKDKDIKYTDALLAGIMQAIAVAPAISRSGSTIGGSLFAGMDRETAARFSFLMSIPVILGATVLNLKDIIDVGMGSNGLSIMPMISGFAASMLSGYLSVKFMLTLIKKCKLKYFSYYVFALAFFILADQLVFKIFF